MRGCFFVFIRVLFAMGEKSTHIMEYYIYKQNIHNYITWRYIWLITLR